MTVYEIFKRFDTIAAPLITECENPWNAIPKIKDYIFSLIPTLDREIYKETAPNVFVAKRYAPSVRDMTAEPS